MIHTQARCKTSLLSKDRYMDVTLTLYQRKTEGKRSIINYLYRYRVKSTEDGVPKMEKKQNTREMLCN